MAGRILTLQRQVRELGRLRAGLTETATTKDGKPYERPTSSKTWILTSANRDYLDAAAQLWGGEVLEWTPVGNGPKAWRLITGAAVIDAILPPGDPLSQYNEMWSRGGCQRRCDGEQEMLSGNPCLCRAQHGDDFHEQRQGTVCDIHTRLNVFLPDLPDIGVWRCETKGFWPANHIAGYVDMIKGQVGPQVLVPVRLRIEPRMKVRAGKTSQYIEIVVELRSRASMSEIMATPQVIAIGGPADSRVIEAAPERAQIEAVPAAAQPDWYRLADDARDADTVRALWKQARQAGGLDDRLAEHLKARVADLEPREPGQAAPLVVEGEPTEFAANARADANHPGRPWPEFFATAKTVDEMRSMWTQCGKAGALNEENKRAWFAANARLRSVDTDDNSTAGGEDGGPVEAPAGAVETAEVEPDKDLTWTSILTEAFKLGWNTPTTSKAFREQMGRDVADADGWTMAQFLEHLRSTTNGANQ